MPTKNQFPDPIAESRETIEEARRIRDNLFKFRIEYDEINARLRAEANKLIAESWRMISNADEIIRDQWRPADRQNKVELQPDED